MIDLLDSHKKQFFATVEGKQPFFQKYTTPITKLRYANTVYNARNTGIDAIFHSDGDTLTGTAYTGRVPFVKFYSGNGVPEVFTKTSNLKNWGIKYQCYFRAPITSNYTFYAGGEGKINILVDGSDVMTSRLIHMDNTDYESSNTVSMTAGEWVPIQIFYRSHYQAGKEAGLVVLWQTSSAKVTPEKVVLSIGNCADYTHSPNVSSSYTVAIKKVPYYSNCSFVEENNGINRLTFDIPFVDTSNIYNSKGYFYYATTDAYIEKSTYQSLQKYRMVEYSEGYRSSNNSDESLYSLMFGLDTLYRPNKRNYIQIAYDPAFNLTTGITIDLWMKSTAIGQSFLICKPARWQYLSPFVDWGIYTTDVTGRWGFRRHDLTSVYTGGPSLNDGNWHNLVFTANGTSWDFYQDGKHVHQLVTTALPYNNSSIGVFIGKSQGFSSLNNQFNGYLDSIKIYSRVLGHDEIFKNYNDGDGNISPYSTDGLVTQHELGDSFVSNDLYAAFHGTFGGDSDPQVKLGKVKYTDQYVTKFTGQIRDFDTNYNEDGNDVVKVTCYDYGIFTRDVINLVSPTPIDYWQAGYVTRQASRVNGETKPRAFDGWEVHKAYEILLTESYIDPYSLFTRKRFANYSFLPTSAGLSIEPIDSSVKSYLPIKSHYGRPTVTEADEQLPDDTYAYKADTGEYYKDVIDKIMRPFYYNWGFDRYGNPFLRRVNVPIYYKDDRDLDTAGGWTKKTNTKAFKATYNEGNLNANASCNATGKRFAVLFGVGPRFGSADGTTGSVNVQLRKGNTNLVNKNYNLYSSTARFYYDGPDVTTGVNKCFYIVATNLPYDTYRIIVKNINGNYKTPVDGVLSYDYDDETPSNIFYTGDISTSGSVIDLNVKINIDNQRTDCVVLGSRTGTRVAPDEKADFSPVNPNNPIYTYVQSASRDLNSVYKATAVNYVGHPRTTLIHDPSIVSQDQADFISFNVINEYNTPKKELTFTVQGHPKIEVGDCVAVVDDLKKGSKRTDLAWVTEVRNQYTNGQYISEIDTQPIRPVSSFWEKSLPSLQEFNNKVIQNFRLYNNGWVSRLSASFSITATNMGISHNTKQLPPKGYAKLKKEIIKYSRVSTADSGTYFLRGMTRSINGVSATSGAVNDPVVVAYDPYIQESLGLAPIIEFDCLVSGEIEVAIYNCPENDKTVSLSEISRDTRVDTLSGIGNDGYPQEGYDPVVWGSQKRYIWGAFDQFGTYNNAVSSQKIGKGYYVGENYYLRKGTSASNKDTSLPYGRFCVEIKVKPDDKTIVADTFRSDVHGTEGNQYIYTSRGEVGKFDLVFNTSNSLYYALATDATDVNYHMWSKSESEALLNNANVIRASVYPNITRNAIKYTAFCVNQSNNSRGFGFKIIDKQNTSLDPDLKRGYFLNMEYNIAQFAVIPKVRVGGTWGNPIIENISLKLHKDVHGRTSDLGNGGIYYGTRDFYFNTKDLANNNEDFKYIPKEFMTAWKNDSTLWVTGQRAFIANMIYFTQGVYDMSGRVCSQARQYVASIPNNEVVYTYFDNTDYQSNLKVFYDVFKSGTRPYLYTGTGGAIRGFYQFKPSQIVDSNYWKILLYSNPENAPLSSRITYNKDFYTEFNQGSTVNTTTKAFYPGRINYIMWVDEEQVNRLAIFKSGSVFLKLIYEVFSDKHYVVPSLWSIFKMEDFT